MERYRGKMQEFVSKLWNNPNIEQVPLVKKENHILSFIQENRQNLQQAFASESFFPEITWDESIRLLFTVLTDLILDQAQPMLDDALECVNHPELKEQFAKEGGLSINTLGLRNLILDMMRSKRMRDHFMGCLVAIDADFYRRYIPPVIQYRKLIYIDLVRRDHLEMSADVIADYISLASLFRPLAFYPIDTPNQSGDVLIRQNPGSRSYEQILQTLKDKLDEACGGVPDSLLDVGLEGARNVLDYPDVHGSSRIINIFWNRAQEYVSNLKHDRGAETPDKSWFNINRRTARQSGMDVRFLEELYLIAGEEGW